MKKIDLFYSIRIKMQKFIPFVEKNQDKINWRFLSMNPNAISLLEKNQSNKSKRNLFT
jgi:hypothetical protein